MNDGDLIIQVSFNDMCLTVNHEGRSGDHALMQATLLQLPDRWRETIAATFTITAAEPDDDPA
jgi:hypothetical protein